MANKGLFSTIFTTTGPYQGLFSYKGVSPAVERTDLRLGQADGQSVRSFFEQDFYGIPVWILGIFFLGFAYSYRKKRKSESKN